MHKFCRSGATKFDMFTNAGIVKHVETIFLKPLSWRCITSVIVGRSQCCKEKAFLWETNTKINFPGKPTHEIKSLTNMGFVISAENIFSQPLCWRCINLDTAGRSHFYKENWEFCKKIFPKHTSQVSHMFSHRGEDLKMQDCDRCGKYFIKSAALKIVPKPTSQVCNKVNQLMR